MRPSAYLQAQGIIPVTPDPQLEESNTPMNIVASRGSNEVNRTPSLPIPGPSNVVRNATVTPPPIPVIAREIDVKPIVKIESDTGYDDEELALLEVCVSW